MNRHLISRGPLRLRVDHNGFGPGWVVALRLGRGAGCRALDLPWHSQSVHSPRWRRTPWLSYIPGYTLTVATHQRRIGSAKFLKRPEPRWVWLSLTSKGNGRDFIPGWW